MKKFVHICFALFLLVSCRVSPVFAQTENQTPFIPEVMVFVRDGCGHCQAEKEYLQQLQKTESLRVTLYNLKDSASQALFEKFTGTIGISKVTPITVVGTSYIVGFDREDTTGKEISLLISSAVKNETPTLLDKVEKNSGIAGGVCDESGLVPCEVKPKGITVSLPLVGRIDSSSYPLIALAAILGFFDGFNPCAMWVLVTFLLILLQTGSRKKMLVFAGVFVLAEAIMYAAILTVWYKTWNFVKLDSVITPLIGVVTIVGGVLFIREWRKKELECRVTDIGARHKTHEKLKKLATDKFTIFTFIGILGVAFSVNIIEFACSVGIPQAFTKILELNHVTSLQNGFMVLIYIFFYMIDDFIVFGLALYGADKLALTGKYSKLSNLVGGILMLVLGIIMLVNPGLVLFK